MSDYLTEAFQKLRLVEDDFDLSADANKIDELKSFVADDIEVPEEEVIDVEAVSEDDLENNYNGKVILECECCHSRIYKDMDEVFIDDESNTANIDEECPVCNNTLGYSVIGKIEPYEQAKEINVTVKDEDGVEPELESLKKTYKGGIKIKEDLGEIKDDELPDDDVEMGEACSKKKLTEAPWVWQPDDDESEEPDSPMPEDEEDYEEDGVPFINGKYTPGPLTQEVIDALYESGDYWIKNSGLKSNWDKDIWGLEDIYDSMENSGDPESGMSIDIEESPEADGKWRWDPEFVDTGALINTLRRYVLIGLEKKYGQKWKDILDSHPEKSWYMDYHNIPEPTVAKDRQEMIDGAKAIIKAARENGSFEESLNESKLNEGGSIWSKLVRAYPELESGKENLDELFNASPTINIDASGQSVGFLGGTGGAVSNEELENDKEELNELFNASPTINLDASGSSVGFLNGRAGTVSNEEVETCPECGKSPCECEKVEEACSKKSKKGSACDKLKKKNPELREGKKLTEAPWVWKDEPDEDDVVLGADNIITDGEGNDFTEEEINTAVKKAAEIVLADTEAVEIGEWVKEKAGLPDNIDPLLAYCKFESEIDEMPGEGLIGDIISDDDSEFYDYWLNVDDFEERIAEYLGEFGLEKFGHTAWAKCKIRPGAFYDFGESFKESVEVTAKGEDNVNVSKNDDGSMDINVSSTEPGEGEEIVPLDDEEISEIEENEPEDEGEEEEIETEEGEIAAEGGEEETTGEGIEEVGEFSEEEFDNMGESYMRKVYSNVKSYKTNSVATTGSDLIIEGIISFRSGAQKKTTFVLKDLGINKHGKRIFEGYNKTFSNSSKAFRITGGVDKGRYYPRTFKYNYKTKTINESNKSEVFGVKGLIKAENCRKRHGR